MARGIKNGGDSTNLRLLREVLKGKNDGFMELAVPGLGCVVNLQTGRVYKKDAKTGVCTEAIPTLSAGHLFWGGMPVHVLVAFSSLQYEGRLSGDAPRIRELVSDNKLAICHANGDGTDNRSQNLEVSDEFHNQKNKALVYGLQQWYPSLYTRKVVPIGSEEVLLVLKGQSITVDDIDGYLKYIDKPLDLMSIAVNTAMKHEIDRFIRFMHNRRPLEWPLAPGLTEEQIARRSYDRRVKNPTLEMLTINNFWKEHKLFKSQQEFAKFAGCSPSKLSTWLSGELNLLNQKKKAALLWHILAKRCKELGIEFAPDGMTPEQISDYTGEA